MSQHFFRSVDLCNTLLTYLDYSTIIAFADSNVCAEKEFINIKHTFRAYINEWSAREKQYGFPYESWDETFVMLDGIGWCKYTLINVYNIDDCGNTEFWEKLDEYLENITMYNIDHEMSCDKYVDKIQCEYDTNDNKWKYKYELLLDEFEFRCRKSNFNLELSRQKLLRFNGDEIENIMKEFPYMIKKKSLSDRICKLLGITIGDKHKLGVCSMIKKWYLSTFRRTQGYNDWEDYFTIYGLINFDIIPKQWKNQQNDCEYDSNDEDFFIVFNVYTRQSMP
eukprot:171016_1